MGKCREALYFRRTGHLTTILSEDEHTECVGLLDIPATWYVQFVYIR